MNQSKVRWSSLASLTLLYLALPLVIFFTGWLKPVWAVAAIVPVVFCGWALLRGWPAEPPSLRPRELLLVGVFSFALTAFLGIGAFTPQQTDWIKHNAMLFDCIKLPWPVILVDGSDRWPLVYYLAYYLPAAVVGKVAGYAAAQAALWVWSSLGVMLACFWFARLTKLPASVAALAFFAFSGLDFLASLVAQLLGLSELHGPLSFYPNQSWSRIWQFPAHLWALEWAPGQALAGWLSAGMFLASPKPLRSACFLVLFTCVVFWSPFAGFGLALLVFFLFLREKWEKPVKPLAAMLALILPLSALAAFYTSKISLDVTARFPVIPVCWFTRFYYAPDPLGSVVLLLLFVVFNFGLWLWFIRARFPKGTGERNLAAACGLALVCLLPITVGSFNDLPMRASAAPLFCLALLTVRTLVTPGLAPNLRRWFWLLVLIGLLTPFIETAHQAYHIVIRKYDPRTVPHQVSAVVNMADDGFHQLGAQYIGSTNSFFSRILAR